MGQRTAGSQLSFPTAPVAPPLPLPGHGSHICPQHRPGLPGKLKGPRAWASLRGIPGICVGGVLKPPPFQGTAAGPPRFLFSFPQGSGQEWPGGRCAGPCRRPRSWQHRRTAPGQRPPTAHAEVRLSGPEFYQTKAPEKPVPSPFASPLSLPDWTHLKLCKKERGECENLSCRRGTPIVCCTLAQRRQRRPRFSKLPHF